MTERLPAAEKATLLALVVAGPLLVRLLPWRQTLSLAERWALRPLQKDRAQRALEWAEQLWSRRGLRRWCHCLPRALIRFRYLRAAGQPVTLHLGLRRVGAGWLGHAWVCLAGSPVAENAAALQGYCEMLRVGGHHGG